MAAPFTFTTAPVALRSTLFFALFAAGCASPHDFLLLPARKGTSLWELFPSLWSTWLACTAPSPPPPSFRHQQQRLLLVHWQCMMQLPRLFTLVIGQSIAGHAQRCAKLAKYQGGFGQPALPQKSFHSRLGPMMNGCLSSSSQTYSQ